jgi:hypothetical protein
VSVGYFVFRWNYLNFKVSQGSFLCAKLLKYDALFLALFAMSYEYAVAPCSSENNNAIEFYKWCFENLNKEQG